MPSDTRGGYSRQRGQAGLVALIALGAAFTAVPAQAENDAKTFLQTYKTASLANQQSMRDDLKWVEIGISWVNVDLKTKHQRQLYCQPGKLSLTGEQLIDMLQKHVQEVPIAADYPFGLMLLEALIKVFPCSPGPN
jgi:hypothetical protein